MILYTRNGLSVECTPIKSLSNGRLLVFSQDRLVLAQINSAIDCNEIDSIDLHNICPSWL
jgi:hypothetical protein